MRVSKYIRVDPNVLLEYVYDDGNLIGEAYEILVNIKNNNYSYMASNTSGDLSNNQSNQLFQIDPVKNTYGLVDPTSYSFLQINQYPSGFPVRFDTIIVHIPINYTFGQNIGFYLQVYAFDVNNVNTYEISNFFFDITDISTSNLLGYTAPPLLFQGQLWGKNIQIQLPSVFAVSNQLVKGNPQLNTINYNLTNGIGLSTHSPVFINFQFLQGSQTINSVTTYTLSSPFSVSVPQTPQFENLGVIIEESVNGDFFDIYGVYEGTIAGFNDFINNAVYSGNNYYVQYTVTIFEENIRGKSITISVNSNFNEPIEYRPIIKYSTTTAIIDVEMSLIDATNNSQIIRMASYGMLSDQVSKYSLNLMKINLASSNKPVIYNLKNTITTNQLNSGVVNSIFLEPIKVPYPVLVDRLSVVAKSDNVIVGKDIFFGIGKLVIYIYPFDNIFSFVIASQVVDGSPNFMDLTNMGQILFTIQNSSITVSSTLYTESGSINLAIGMISFKLPASKINDVKTIYASGLNVFYITGTNNGTTSIIYTGLFNIYDSTANVATLNTAAASQTLNVANTTPYQIDNSSPSGIAVVTRKVITTNATASGTSSTS